jgi:hypothetical protein
VRAQITTERALAEARVQAVSDPARWETATPAEAAGPGFAEYLAGISASAMFAGLLEWGMPPRFTRDRWCAHANCLISRGFTAETGESARVRPR